MGEDSECNKSVPGEALASENENPAVRVDRRSIVRKVLIPIAAVIVGYFVYLFQFPLEGYVVRIDRVFNRCLFTIKTTYGLRVLVGRHCDETTFGTRIQVSRKY